MTETTETDETDQEWAEEMLLDAVDNIADVQNHYDELTDEQEDMLADAKSGIAAVYTNLDGEVVFDL
ncbi:hypothetical protein [Natrinema versiforme]|uniref:Uncharacterized protein n=1 Tax=Natrinema versiforme JCM 10478 TaxID=1227496 RepID=L9Y594_9EURY|nr:hypothetical protein [Natrinema versiforme]ELY68897.1 hypothetical protein C489_06008 [Natrinema versiforme JCM 10478]